MALWAGITDRIEYLCNLVFGGNFKGMAQVIGVSPTYLSRMLANKQRSRLVLVSQLVQHGLVNANWLLTGTGPIRPCDRELPIDLPPPASSPFPFFDTRQVQYCLPKPVAPLAPPAEQKPDSAAFQIARHVYEARKTDKPVILFLDAAAITDDIGAIVGRMMQAGYVTGVALSSAAAERDLERALYGGWAAPSKRVESFNTLLNAASIAACNGLGWGLAAGRWCFPPDSDRQASVLAAAYELGVPATVHLALGDCVSHLFPSIDGASRGAALGAASYLDLLVFAEQVRNFATMPNPGLFLNASDGNQGYRLMESVIEATTGSQLAGLPLRAFATISEEYRYAFPALLAACDAVYDGSADDGR